MPSTCTVMGRTATNGTTIVLEHCQLTIHVPLSELTFQWSKNDVDIMIVSGGQFSVNFQGSLVIKNVQKSDMGNYKVNISNDAGSAVHTVKLDVVEPTSASNNSP